MGAAGDIVIRRLVEADLPDAMALVRAAGWNQIEEDWRNLLALEPEGCFALESGGKVVSTATAVRHGGGLAWIGMVLTDPAHRGRGHARRLMERALEYLDEQGVPWSKLDATAMGHHLYATLGYVDEGAAERWRRDPSLGACGREASLAYEPMPELDLAAFGADRSRLLDYLRRYDAASVPGAGFAFGRPGNSAAYFGPCVCRLADAARVLLERYLAAHSHEPVYWDILPANREALRLAEEYGFERQRILTRMGRSARSGTAPLGKNDQYVFALAGFEYG